MRRISSLSMLFILLAIFSCGHPDGKRVSAIQELYLADSLLKREKTIEALEYYIALAEEGERTQDKGLAGLANMGIAEVMRQSWVIEEEIRFAEKAIQLLTDNGDFLNANAARWHLQSAYATLKNYDKSLKEAETIIRTATALQDTTTLVKTLESAINTCRRNYPEYADSLFSYFHQLESLHHPISSNVYSSLAFAYHAIGQEDAANLHLSLAEKASAYSGYEVNTIYEKYIIAHDRGKPNADDLILLLWNMQQLRLQKRIESSAITIMNSISENRVQMEAERNRSIRLHTTVIILCCLLALSLLAGAFLRHRKVTELEKKHLSEALDAQVSALEELKVTLHAKSELATQLEFGTLDTLCEEYYTGGNLSERRVAKAFEQMVLRYRNDPVFWNAFEQRVNEMHEGVISMMKKELAGFKPDDFRLMTYIVSGMSYFSISVLMGVDKPVLYNRAKRLRDRIRASGAHNKEQFVNAISRTSVDILRTGPNT